MGTSPVAIRLHLILLFASEGNGCRARPSLKISAIATIQMLYFYRRIGKQIGCVVQKSTMKFPETICFSLGCG
jgi:hypothetical protein